MKEYKVLFKSFGVSKGYTYCIAEDEDKAKIYIASSIDDGVVLSVEEIDINSISINDLSVGDLARLVKFATAY